MHQNPAFFSPSIYLHYIYYEDMNAEVEMTPNVPRRIAQPVLPWLEEMAKADRQMSTATTFKSMMAEGLMSWNWGQLFMLALKRPHMHTHACAPAVTLLSLWSRVPVATATEWVCAWESHVPCKLRQVWWETVKMFIGLLNWEIILCYSCTTKSPKTGYMVSRLQEKLTWKQKCA